ncbi:MAG: 3-hydroxyacyl-CoA dehydrogenase NAD-binding domain-containing protein [Gammaproteobacteria bacterium]
MALEGTSGVVRVEMRGAVAVLWMNNPPVNALGASLREALDASLRYVHADTGARAIVLTGSGRAFCGGADIREFDVAQPHDTPLVPDLIERLEQGELPVVAAIHGFALGGGFELSLGCHFRIGTTLARVGLPEVKLGLMPGAGGTQRLPRLIGLAPAMNAIVSGNTITARDALKAGVFDEVTDGDVVAVAVDFANGLIQNRIAPRRSRDLVVSPAEPEAVDEVVTNVSERITAKSRGLLAPFHCIESVANAARMDFDQALQRERELFVECRESEQSKAQRHLFFAERKAAKVADLPDNVRPAEIRRAAVVGCGTMGAGIAVCFANAGIPVRVLEQSSEALGRGLSRIQGIYEGLAARGRLGSDDARRRMALIEGVEDTGSLADVDIVIEAIVEDMEAKKALLAELDARCGERTILATNTSTLDVNELAAATRRPDRVIGMHFFSPAQVMRLLENVRGTQSSAQTIATVMALSKRLAKVAALVGVCDGFVGNRMYHTYTRQAYFALEEGALPQQVDRALYDFGMAMGPFAVMDMSGLDVSWRVRQRRAATRPANERYCTLPDKVCEAGRFGQKSGAGWYRYANGGRRPEPDPVIERLIVEHSLSAGIERRTLSDTEIQMRCVCALINEGAKIIEEDLVSRASDIDVIWVHGYGFPLYRGGPMFYADRLGLGRIYETISRLYDEQGEVMAPAVLLYELAHAGKGFHE